MYLFLFSDSLNIVGKSEAKEKVKKRVLLQVLKENVAIINNNSN